MKAAEQGKESTHIQGWVGRFFLKVRENEAKSLHYYLNVYFLDPHFYDTEYAEGRIRKLNFKAAEAIVEKALKDGKQLEDLLKHDNPVVVSLTLGRLAKPWDVKNRKHFLEALDHDDPTTRMQAVGALMDNPDKDVETDIQTMLAGKDLRKRGLACYLAVKIWKDKGVDAVKPNLADKAQLVRFDAISALWDDGGERGKTLVREHRKNEKHPWLVRMIDSLDKKSE